MQSNGVLQRCVAVTCVAVACVAVACVAIAIVSPSTARAQSDSVDVQPATWLRDYLAHSTKDIAQSGSKSKQFDALLTQSSAAENRRQFGVAIDDLAIAINLAPSFPQRDTLTQVLRGLIRQHTAHTAGKAAQVDSSVAKALDRGFLAAYDKGIPVATVTPSTNGRVVLAEYRTGTQCSMCWIHDRVFAALLQRYPSTNVVALAYHGGSGYPIVTDDDSLWQYVVGGQQSLYRIRSIAAVGDIGWVDGQKVFSTLESRLDSVIAGDYALMTPVIDKALEIAPQTDIALTVTPRGVSDTRLAGIDVRVRVRVTPKQARSHLGVRLVLVEDTVRVTGFTNRRLQYAAVRTVAWPTGRHAKHDYRDLFFPISAHGNIPTTVTYHFDVEKLQQTLLNTHQTDETARLAFPDANTWRMQPRRLGIVAIVQDMETREVLQTAYQRVLSRTP